MPRKAWKQKNRYCWNSNLNEEMFLVLLRLYCAAYTCTRAKDVVARYAKRHSQRQISRQTINRYYLMFGDYLYELLPDQYRVENFPLEPDDDMPTDEGERQRYVALQVLLHVHWVLYDRLAASSPANAILISNKTIPAFDFMKGDLRVTEQSA